MSDFEDRIRDEGRELAARAEASADTDAAWRALHTESVTGAGASPERSRPRWAWVATAAAGMLVVAAIASTLFVGGGDDDPDAAQPALSTPIDTTPPNSDQPNPTAESTTAPTLPESGPATTRPIGDEVTPVVTITVPLPPDRPCTYTDPARRAITVARALTCPDGTDVWVDGVVVKVGDVAYLCDHVSGVEGVPCDGATLVLVGFGWSSNMGYDGVKSGGELRLDERRPTLPPIPIPTMPSD